MKHQHLHARRPRPSSVAPGVPPLVDEVIVRAMSRDPADRHPTPRALAAAFRAALLAEVPSTPSAVRALGAYLDLRVDAAALEDPDEALLVDMDVVLAEAQATLVACGFVTVLSTGTSALFALPLPGPPEEEPAVRRAAVEGVVALADRLRARQGADERLAFDLCLHVDRLLLVGGKVRGGDLTRLGSWVAEAADGAVVGTPAVFAGTGLATEPVPGRGVLRLRRT